VSNESAVRVLVVDPAVWLDTACRVAGRSLTEDEWREVLPDRPYAPACT
jgi:hypothetical protein